MPQHSRPDWQDGPDDEVTRLIRPVPDAQQDVTLVSEYPPAFGDDDPPTTEELFARPPSANGAGDPRAGKRTYFGLHVRTWVLLALTGMLAAIVLVEGAAQPIGPRPVRPEAPAEPIVPAVPSTVVEVLGFVAANSRSERDSVELLLAGQYEAAQTAYARLARDSPDGVLYGVVSQILGAVRRGCDEAGSVPCASR